MLRNDGDSMKKTKRTELKYLISYMEYIKLKPLLETMLVHDQHGDEESYPVHSIYFDDIEFSGVSDKAFGNEYHKKYRIRYYDNHEQMKLEIKEKNGNNSIKSSTYITKELFQSILDEDMDFFYRYLEDEVIRRFVLDFKKRHLLPKVMISYKREAYKDESDNLRITFDHSLSGELYDYEIVESDQKLLNDHMMILEIKYEHFMPKNIQTIINQIKPNQIAYSKYYYGYQRAFN